MLDIAGIDRVTAHFVTEAAKLGFTPPPVALRIKLLEGQRCWTIYVRADHAPSETPRNDLLLWLCAFGPRRVEFGARGVLRADFDFLPPAWNAGLGSVRVDMLTIDVTGRASLLVTGAQESVLALGRALGGAEQDAPALRALGPSVARETFLTKGQEQALATAVRAGYYKIPRPINLQQLAARLNVASGSLSERLRRAEGRVIERYVARGGAPSWAAPFDDEETG